MSHLDETACLQIVPPMGTDTWPKSAPYQSHKPPLEIKHTQANPTLIYPPDIPECKLQNNTTIKQNVQALDHHT